MTAESATSILQQPAGAGLRALFLADRPVSAVCLYGKFLALWTMAFFLPRLAHLDELYGRPVLRVEGEFYAWLALPAPSEAVLMAMALLLLGALVGFCLSSRPRLFHLLILVLLFAFDGLNTLVSRGYGQLAFVQWFLLFLAPYERLREDDGRVREGPCTGQRLLQMQWAAVYFFTVLAKAVGGKGWWDGQTLYHALATDRWGRWLLSDWIHFPLWLCAIGGVLTLMGELFVASGIFFRRTRRWAMLVCFGLHLGMSLTLRVSLLFPTLMLGHLLLFLSEDEICALRAWSGQCWRPANLDR